MTLMRVRGLSRKPESADTALVLEDLAGRLGLAFFIPPDEVGRVTRVLGAGECRCVPVYEFVAELTKQLGAVLDHVVLDAAPPGICASVLIDGHGGALALPCHPADAVALAVRSRVPIYATAAAIAQACPLTKIHRHTAAPERSDLARWLDGVRPDDFGRPQE